jgi:hypothetical protein
MTRLACSIAVLACVGAALAAQSAQFRARLSVMPLDIAMQATMSGSGAIDATLKGSTLSINGTFAGLKTAATAVRVHRGPRMATRGPAIGDLTATAATSGTITGSIELTRAQIDDLAAGRLYVQLHSEKAPEGNLWGWLLPSEGKK